MGNILGHVEEKVEKDTSLSVLLAVKTGLVFGVLYQILL